MTVIKDDDEVFTKYCIFFGSCLIAFVIIVFVLIVMQSCSRSALSDLYRKEIVEVKNIIDKDAKKEEKEK